jgi:hypothetical protein
LILQNFRACSPTKRILIIHKDVNTRWAGIASSKFRGELKKVAMAFPIVVIIQIGEKYGTEKTFDSTYSPSR